MNRSTKAHRDVADLVVAFAGFTLVYIEDTKAGAAEKEAGKAAGK